MLAVDLTRFEERLAPRPEPDSIRLGAPFVFDYGQSNARGVTESVRPRTPADANAPATPAKRSRPAAARSAGRGRGVMAHDLETLVDEGWAEFTPGPDS